MAIDLYYVPGSAPCRLVLLVAAALDIQLNLNLVDLRAGDQLKPEFLKSRAIGRYFATKYGANTLYPKDPQTRALIDQRLDFDLGSLYPSFANYFYPTLFGGAKPDADLLKKLEGKLDFLNTFLDGQKYAVGSQLTLADLSLVATVSTIDAAGISLAPYPNVLVAAALDIKLNQIHVDLKAGDHLKPEYLKLNPQHTIPTIVDDGFSLWESRAIGRYFATKYGANKLYPEDPQTRALIDQRLDFDLGSLYPTFANYFYPMFFASAKPDEELLKKLEEKLNILNTFLDGQKYAVGSQLSLADLCLVATLVKSTAPSYEEANQKGIDDFKTMIITLKKA
ncbi:Glutathione S-transferase 1-6, partial [Operophtera brumata]